jgi:hypothetical protein
VNDTATAEQPVTETDGWEWCFLEIMGHRSHWGRSREEERFGSKMIRIDVPSFRKPSSELEVAGDASSAGIRPAEVQIVWTTHYYGGASIFSYSLTDEATVMKRNKPYEPPSRISLPAPSSEDADEPFHDPDDHNPDDDEPF